MEIAIGILDIVRKQYGFRDAIANSIAWISLSFPVFIHANVKCIFASTLYQELNPDIVYQDTMVWKLYRSVVIFNKYKTFSVLIYSYINTSGNWENEKLCGNTTPEGRSVFTQFRVFPISTSVDITVYQYGKNVLYLFYNIAQRNIKKEIFRRFRVDIELYQHGS